MAGVGEACAHVGSVLFVAEANTKTKQQMSSTSLPCAWLPCSEEVIDKSAVQTKKVCKMSPPTPEQIKLKVALLCYHICQNSMINVYQ